MTRSRAGDKSRSGSNFNDSSSISMTAQTIICRATNNFNPSSVSTISTITTITTIKNHWSWGSSRFQTLIRRQLYTALHYLGLEESLAASFGNGALKVLAKSLSDWPFDDLVLGTYLFGAASLLGDSGEEFVLSTGGLSTQRRAGADGFNNWDLDDVLAGSACSLAQRLFKGCDVSSGQLGYLLQSFTDRGSFKIFRHNITADRSSLKALLGESGFNNRVGNGHWLFNNCFFLNNRAWTATFFISWEGRVAWASWISCMCGGICVYRAWQEGSAMVVWSTACDL